MRSSSIWFDIPVIGPFFRNLMQLTEEKGQSLTVTNHNDTKEKVKTGRILRTAARRYDSESSKPSSRNYTTRKNALPAVFLSTRGVEGDYNHYRTIALKSTLDRAVSILTDDVIKYLQSLYPESQEGDLGENLYMGGMEFRSFAVGTRLQIGSDVLLEITEPMEPCANLCKLPFINDANLEPRERLEKCQKILQDLGRFAGLRGWYAKVLQEGTVSVGQTVRMM
jgi:MOSC domain-containing protein YiiM